MPADDEREFDPPALPPPEPVRFPPLPEEFRANAWRSLLSASPGWSVPDFILVDRRFVFRHPHGVRLKGAECVRWAALPAVLTQGRPPAVVPLQTLVEIV